MDIDPQRVNREVGIIVDQIIERLVSNPGTNVQIRIEISASNPDGFDDSTVRTIKENSCTLKFNNFDFEAD